jgi:hypothetical protein
MKRFVESADRNQSNCFRRAQHEESVVQYLSQLDTADRQEPSEGFALKTKRLKEKLVKVKGEMRRLAEIEKQMPTLGKRLKVSGKSRRASLSQSTRALRLLRSLAWTHYARSLLLSAPRGREAAASERIITIRRSQWTRISPG